MTNAAGQHARRGRARRSREVHGVDPQDLVLTALRASLIYFFLLVIIRLLGKRSVGPNSAFDLLVALMLGEVVDEAIFGDVSMVKGLLAIVVIAAWHFINEVVSFRSQKVDELTAGKPTVLMEHGQFKDEALAKERLNRNEVLAQMRLQSIDDTAEVKRATLEPSGQISFIKEDAAEPVQKGDLELLEQLR
jgi:uncharacterized membrane protein YcaP (DUF421 family)